MSTVGRRAEVLPFDGDAKGEGAAFPGAGTEANGAVRMKNEALDDGEPEAAALAGRFCSEIGFENFGEEVFGDAGTIILDGNGEVRGGRVELGGFENVYARAVLQIVLTGAEIERGG